MPELEVIGAAAAVAPSSVDAAPPAPSRLASRQLKIQRPTANSDADGIPPSPRPMRTVNSNSDVFSVADAAAAPVAPSRPGSRGPAMLRPIIPEQSPERPGTSGRPGTAVRNALEQVLAGAITGANMEKTLDPAAAHLGEAQHVVDEDDDCDSVDGAQTINRWVAPGEEGGALTVDRWVAPDEEDDEAAMEPPSPSLLSVHGDRSELRSPSATLRALDEEGCDSPSILVLESEAPTWASHKPLPPPPQEDQENMAPQNLKDQPTTPPSKRNRNGSFSARGPREERPVKCGQPQPLSARGEARCSEFQNYLEQGGRPGHLSARGSRRPEPGIPTAMLQAPLTERGPPGQGVRRPRPRAGGA